MASYMTFSSSRTTTPDPEALAAAVKSGTNDPTAVLAALPDGKWRGKKAAEWTAGDISAVQTALDTVGAYDEVAADVDRLEIKTTVVCGLWGRLGRQPTGPEITAERTRWMNIRRALA
jgi:hypothetical protein